MIKLKLQRLQQQLKQLGKQLLLSFFLNTFTTTFMTTFIRMFIATLTKKLTQMVMPTINALLFITSLQSMTLVTTLTTPIPGLTFIFLMTLTILQK